MPSNEIKAYALESSKKIEIFLKQQMNLWEEF